MFNFDNVKIRHQIEDALQGGISYGCVYDGNQYDMVTGYDVDDETVEIDRIYNDTETILVRDIDFSKMQIINMLKIVTVVNVSDLLYSE